MHQTNRENVTIISGGGSGLGKELAREALSRGKNVIILGRDEKKLHCSADELKSQGNEGCITPFRCDITSQNDIDSLSEMLLKNQFIIDFLFNNAGTGYFKKVTENRSPDVDTIVGSNFTGLILLTSAMMRLVNEANPITIVNVMSTSALIGRGNQTVYCAAKWGARGFTEALRDELKGTRNRVIAIYPGGMKTPFYDGDPRDVSSFMNPADVAGQIAQAVFDQKNILVSDITILRP